MHRYKGPEDPKEHVWFCDKRWVKNKIPKEEWTHSQIYSYVGYGAVGTYRMKQG